MKTARAQISPIRNLFIWRRRESNPRPPTVPASDSSAIDHLELSAASRGHGFSPPRNSKASSVPPAGATLPNSGPIRRRGLLSVSTVRRVGPSGRCEEPLFLCHRELNGVVGSIGSWHFKDSARVSPAHRLLSLKTSKPCTPPCGIAPDGSDFSAATRSSPTPISLN